MIYTALSSPNYRNEWIPTVPSSKFPSTFELLCQGGDARISLISNSALNKYGCSSYPDPGLVTFSSSTASIISDAAFAATDELRDKLIFAIDEELPEVIYTNELHRIKNELVSLCGLDDIANMEVIIGASGTDLHLIAAQLASGNNGKPVLAIMPDAMETGTGVPAALSSSHFSSCSALGESVTEGLPVKQTNAVDVVSVSMRYSDGNLRPESIIDSEVVALVENAVDHGQQVLLILVDTSKTGLISPSPSCAIRLKQRYPNFVDILVDACQFRISTSTLRAYLEYDFMVMITGSKFLTGPVFSGALFIPTITANKILSYPISLGLRAYSSRAEWPRNCEASKSLNNVANFGLLLRWQAALEELRLFKSVPESQVASFTQRFANIIQNRLKLDENFSQIQVRALDRFPLVNDDNWDQVPTIFSFTLFRHGANGLKQPLTHQETLKIYKWLQLDPGDSERPDIKKLDKKVPALRCQLGQPVIYGSHNGKPISALRLCLSARLIVEATLNNDENADDVIQRALSVLDNVSHLIRML